MQMYFQVPVNKCPDYICTRPSPVTPYLVTTTTPAIITTTTPESDTSALITDLIKELVDLFISMLSLIALATTL